MSESEGLTMMVKEEASASANETITAFINLCDEIDIATILHIISPRLFDRFSIWDLIMQKAKLNVDLGAMETVICDTEALLSELKLLIEGCLTPVKLSKWTKYEYGKRKRKRYEDDCIEVDEMLSLALCIDAGIWKRKSIDEVEYQNNILNVASLFPENTRTDLHKKVKVQLEEGEEEESDDENDENKEKEARTYTGKKRGRKPKVRSEEDEENEEEKKTYTCDKCGKTYTNSTMYYSHVEKVCAVKVEPHYREEGEMYFCEFELCPRKEQPFETKTGLEIHWANAHIEKKDKIIPCVLCDRRFATADAKKEHMARDHTKSHKCDHCDEAFLTEGQLKRHMKAHKDIVKKEIGEPIRNYLCLKCGQAMTQEYGKKHEAKCNGQRVRRPEYKKVNGELFCTVYGCKLGYGFQSEYGLRKHFHDKHVREDEKYFACDYCDEKFSFRTTRNKHVKLRHLKSYICDLCGRAFGSRDKVNKHRLTHTGEKPHACDKCDYRAANRSNLTSHKQSKHGDFQQKNFLCTLCNKQFTTMGRVHRHMIVAHGDDKDETATKKKKSRPQPQTTYPLTQALQEQQAVLVQKAPQTQRRVQKRVQIQPGVTHEVIEEHHQVTVDAQEQEAAVQYLQQQLEGPHGTVITVTPLYQQ